MALFGMPANRNNPAAQFPGSDLASRALAAKFSQDQAAQAAALEGQRIAADANIGTARERANESLYSQPALFAKNLSDLYGNYGQASVGALGSYANPYANAYGSYSGGLASLGKGASDMYSSAISGLGGMGTAGVNAMGAAAGQLAGSGMNALGGLYQSGNSALANAYGNSAAAQSGRDSALAGAYGSLGVAGQGALSGIANSALSSMSARDQAALSAAASMNNASANTRASAINAAGQLGAAGLGAMSARDQAALNAIGAIGASANSGRGAGMNALGAIGSAGLGAMGQLGSAQSASLANQSIAAANAYGQLGTALANMQGQFGNSAAAVAAAEAAALGNAAAAQQAAGPQYAKLQFLQGALPSVLDTVKYGFQSRPDFSFSSGGGGGGPGGFSVTGPGGLIAQGDYGGGYDAGGMSASSSSSRPPAPPTGPLPPFSYAPPALPDFSSGSRETRSFLQGILDNSAERDAVRGDLARQLDANRTATMSTNQDIRGAMDSLVSRVDNSAGVADYGPIDKILGASNYRPEGMMGQLISAGNTAPDYAILGGLVGSSNYRPEGLMDKASAQLEGSYNRLGAIQGGDYGGADAMGRISDNIGLGAGSISSGMSGGGLLSGLSGGISGVMGSAADYMNPMLKGGVSALSGIGDQMASGFGNFRDDVGSAYRGTQYGLDRRYESSFDGMGDLFAGTIGKLPQWQTPVEQRMMQQQVADYDRQSRLEAAKQRLAAYQTAARV